MTDSEKKILEGFLSKTLKIGTEELASLYNDAGDLTDLSIAEKADSERVKKLGGVGSDQFKRGVKEGASKIEKAVKDKYGVESDLEGVELVDFILTEKITEAQGTKDDITKHPDFLRQQHEWEKQLKAKDKELADKIAEKEKEFQKKTIMSKIERRAVEELERLRPILPSDAKKAQRWKEKYIDEFRMFDYEEIDGDIILLRDGEPVKDSHGHKVTFEDYARETASGFFDFEVAEPRSSTGNHSEPGKPPVKAPTNDDEYFARLKAAKTPEDRLAITESYEKFKSK